MNKMGIQIDLSVFFEDERQMVYIMVDPNWESVDSLQKRVEYLFDVDSVRFLNSDGYYLPPKESIEIIKFCKGLKAFVPNEFLERRKKKKSKKSKFEEKLNNIGDVQEHDDVQKKRKYNSLDSVHYAKRLKSSNAINESLAPSQHDNNCMEITRIGEQMQPSTIQTQHTVEAGSSTKTKAKHSKNCDGDGAGNGHQSKSSVISEKNATSTEKERKLMEKETDNVGENIFNNNAKSSPRSTSISSSTFLNSSKVVDHKHSKRSTSNSPTLNTPFRKTLSSRSHIYFNESCEIENTTNKSQIKSDTKLKTIVIFRCPLQEVISKEETPKPRIFPIERKSSFNKKKKQLIEIRESIVLAPIPNLFFENKSSEVKENSTSNSLVKENSATNLEHEQKNTKISEIDGEADLLKEKTTNVTESTTFSKNVDNTLDKSVEKSQIENNTEVEFSEQNSVSELPTEKINQSRAMSVDCVDLSMESEEGDVTKTKIKISPEKPDVTSDKNEVDLSSDIEEISEIIDLNETEDNYNSTFNDSCSLNDIKVDKILPFCTNMSELPQINDIMVFKMAYANKKQPSDNTNFLAGKVEYINKRTKSIKILILDGLAEMCHIDSRFILNWRDSEVIIKYLQVKMSDMIQPKIFSKC